MAGNYPDEVRLGQPFPATLGIISKEQGTATYRIEMQINGQTPQVLAKVSLEPGETWEETFDLTVSQSDSTTARVDFYLYREPEAVSYRSVHQSVQIGEPASALEPPPARPSAPSP